MESTRTALPFHQLLRNALPASTRRAANGIRENGNTQFPAMRDAEAVSEFSGSTGSWDPLEQETNARPPSMSLEPRGWLARTAILFFFMSIMFLAGIFIGASLIPASPSLPPPPDISTSVPTAPQIETASTPATTGSGSSPEAATPQAGPTAVTPAESTPPQSISANARPEAVSVPVEPVPASPPQSPSPNVTTGAPLARAEPMTEPPRPSDTVTSTPPPIAPADAPATTAPGLSDIDRQVLLSRGDGFFSAGDVTSARFFYRRGADAGDGTAALRLGETFDAAFLDRAHLGRVPSDLQKAIFWYRQARTLGNAEAEILLKSLPGQ